MLRHMTVTSEQATMS